MSIDEPGWLEEERRLCYVGITRSRRDLVVSCAERRRLRGTESFALPSRFLRELPRHLIEEVRPQVQVSRPLYGAEPRGATATLGEPTGALSLGQRVRHAKFGEGVVLNYEGQGAHARAQVNFADAGAKWLVLAYANLETA
jgi:DNA helicase-2/ATP-dependent DNA helicase PcrA